MDIALNIAENASKGIDLWSNWSNLNTTQQILGTAGFIKDTADSLLSVKRVGNVVGEILGAEGKNLLEKELAFGGAIIGLGTDIADTIQNDHEWNEYLGSAFYMASDVLSLIPEVGGFIGMGVHLIGDLFKNFNALFSYDYTEQYYKEKAEQEAQSHLETAQQMYQLYVDGFLEQQERDREYYAWVATLDPVEKGIELEKHLSIRPSQEHHDVDQKHDYSVEEVSEKLHQQFDLPLGKGDEGYIEGSEPVQNKNEIMDIHENHDHPISMDFASSNQVVSGDMNDMMRMLGSKL
jgi:hypothetical protein